MTQRQNVRKLRLIQPPKYTFGLQRRRRFIYLPARLSNVLRIFSELICSHTQKLQLKLIPQTAVVADTTLPKWSQIIKYFRNRYDSIYDSTRIWNQRTKKILDHCSFLTKSQWGTFNFIIVVHTTNSCPYNDICILVENIRFFSGKHNKKHIFLHIIQELAAICLHIKNLQQMSAVINSHILQKRFHQSVPQTLHRTKNEVFH